MPAVSERQRRLFGIALRIKRGELPRSYSPEAARLADSMSERKLREFAKRTKKKAKGKRKKAKGRRRRKKKRR